MLFSGETELPALVRLRQTEGKTNRMFPMLSVAMIQNYIHNHTFYIYGL